MVFKKGYTPWNKGRPHSDKHKDKLSKIAKQIGSGKWMKGKKLTEEHKNNISLGGSGKHSGENSNFWKGGVSTTNAKIRASKKYAIWRTKVFERDDYTCVECGQRGGKLQADHIKPFADYKELRFEMSNGRTLCLECHMKTETYGWRYAKNKRVEVQ